MVVVCMLAYKIYVTIYAKLYQLNNIVILNNVDGIGLLSTCWFNFCLYIPTYIYFSLNICIIRTRKYFVILCVYLFSRNRRGITCFFKILPTFPLEKYLKNALHSLPSIKLNDLYIGTYLQCNIKLNLIDLIFERGYIYICTVN